MKILLLILLLFVPKAAAAPPWPPSKCTNILKFVEILVPEEDRDLLIGGSNIVSLELEDENSELNWSENPSFG